MMRLGDEDKLDAAWASFKEALPASDDYDQAVFQLGQRLGGILGSRK
jgi:hypothetical protein